MEAKNRNRFDERKSNYYHYFILYYCSIFVSLSIDSQRITCIRLISVPRQNRLDAIVQNDKNLA